MTDKLDRTIDYVKEEFLRAINNFPPFRSPHEGYALILEEVDELWEYVKLQYNDDNRDYGMLKEATHVAAMAIRFICDVCLVEK